MTDDTELDRRSADPDPADEDRRDGSESTGSADVVALNTSGFDGRPKKSGHSNPDDGDDDTDDLTGMVEEPAKVMRIGTMVKQLLEEVRAAPLDERGRERLRDIQERSISELADGLSPELQDELRRLSLPFAAGIPSEAELRVAQAQLVGWLEGLFHGIQTAMVARQMAAQQRAEARAARALPRGAGGGGGGGEGGPVIVGPGGQIIGRLPMGAGGPGGGGPDGSEGPASGTGQYL